MTPKGRCDGGEVRSDEGGVMVVGVKVERCDGGEVRSDGRCDGRER